MTEPDEIKVDHDSLVPLHIQLERQLRSRIATGHWAPGSRLPSENQLQRDLHISRNTVRQAFNEVQHEGLIERIPGKGTFVTAPAAGAGQQQRLVAFIISDFESEREWELLNGAECAARSNDCHIVFYNTRHSAREEQRVLNQLVQQNFSGALLWSCAPPLPAAAARAWVGASLPPLVMMDRDTPALPGDFVTSDNHGGAGLATRHLLAQGHRHIVCLSHDVVRLTPVAERIQGHRDALRAAGQEAAPAWVLPTDTELSPASALKMGEDRESPPMRYLIRRLQQEQPTALFAVNDLVALLALHAAQALQLRVPQDLSIIGFDDVEFSAFIAPPLTTIAQDFHAIGRRSFELLLERMDSTELPARTVRVPVTLRRRATTSSPAEQPALNPLSSQTLSGGDIERKASLQDPSHDFTGST